MASAVRPVVVDTSVVSIIHSGQVLASFYEQEISGFTPVISFQTLEELYFWPLRNGWGERRRRELLRHVDQYEVVWSNQELALISAELRDQRVRAGRRLNTADAWIAATAILLDCPLATHDGDFSDISSLHVIRAT